MISNTELPRVGFRTDPARRQRAGFAHATPAGHHIALCGVHTVYFEGTWPAAGQPWMQLHSRCPTCAQRLYGPDRA